MLRGRIIKATGGFYYVDTPQGIIECRARGVFRRDGITPFVGDNADVLTDASGGATVAEIHSRKNFLIRPPLANIDDMVLVLSTADPAPNLLVVDTLLAVLEHKCIPAIIAITKSDIEASSALEALYKKSGYDVFVVHSRTGVGIDALKERLAGRLCAFSGNSGVGKSTLLNSIDPRLTQPVGDTSKKLGRGRHTTRHVELFAIPGGGMIADTPGFSAMDVVQMSDLRADTLADCFKDFAPYIGHCRFQDCAHIKERECAVLNAVLNGEIAESRHQSYAHIYESLKGIKEWEQKN